MNESNSQSCTDKPYSVPLAWKTTIRPLLKRLQHGKEPKDQLPVLNEIQILRALPEQNALASRETAPDFETSGVTFTI